MAHKMEMSPAGEMIYFKCDHIEADALPMHTGLVIGTHKILVLCCLCYNSIVGTVLQTLIGDAVKSAAQDVVKTKWTTKGA